MTWLAHPLGIYAASRVVTVVALAVAGVLSPDHFADMFFRWDGAWYLALVDQGYPHGVPVVAGGEAAQSTIAFFPGFPLAIRGLQRVTGLPAKPAAIVIVFIFGAAAAVLLWCLVRRVADAAAADRATALFCFFPGSFVLSLAYSEALMLALAAGCLLALISRRWLAAGIAAALATAVRPNAVALVAACAWEAGRALRRREWRAVAAPLLAPVGVLAFFGFLWSRTGEASAWLRTQQDGWEQKVDFGRSTVSDVWRVAQHPIADLNKLIAVASLAFLVVSGVLLLCSKLPAVLTVYTAVVVFMAFASEVGGSRPRFLLTAFPLIVAVAVRIRGLLFTVVLASSALLLAALTILSVASLKATP